MTTTPIYLPTHIDVHQSLVERTSGTFITTTPSIPEDSDLFEIFYPDTFLSFVIDRMSKPLPKNNISCRGTLSPLLFDYLTQKYLGTIVLYAKNVGLYGDFLLSVASYSLERMTPMGFYQGNLTLEPWKGFYLDSTDLVGSSYFAYEAAYEEGLLLKSITLPDFQTMTIYPLE